MLISVSFFWYCHRNTTFPFLYPDITACKSVIDSVAFPSLKTGLNVYNITSIWIDEKTEMCEPIQRSGTRRTSRGGAATSLWPPDESKKKHTHQSALSRSRASVRGPSDSPLLYSYSSVLITEQTILSPKIACMLPCIQQAFTGIWEQIQNKCLFFPPLWGLYYRL